MLEIEIDGQKVEVPPGSTVMDAAHKIGKQIPHFCYHKKLSIAANCRMCLVDVEKIPKAVPACATPVAADMKISTASEKAIKAQKSVMEFLLINHPLDCPICDQGGECQLQDLAVGYGTSSSRYKEEKRVVFNKNLGALINTDMTRCIHCSRCVRFGQEISGVMELGIANRGEHAEVMTFIDKSVDSELSGNAIDLCPVGALTSKPFRFGARTWEMVRRRSVSPHDSLGSNLQVQVKHEQVMRVLPLENEEINECWISDRDRFSYEGLTAADRLVTPRIKHGGVWHDVDWQTALDYIVRTLTDIRDTHGADQIAALVSPQSTLEEMHLASRLMSALGTKNIDSRLRQQDFSLDGKRNGAPWLGMKVADLSSLDSALVVGSFLRKDHPLIAQRLRQAVRHGAKLTRVNAYADDWLIPLAAEEIVSPAGMLESLAHVMAALATQTGIACQGHVAAFLPQGEPSAAARNIAASLLGGNKRAVFLGNLAVQHPSAAALELVASEIARLAGASFGFFGEAAGSVGAYVAGAAGNAGANTVSLLSQPRKAYVLLGVEPEHDLADPELARSALEQAASVIHIGSFTGNAEAYADVMLPVAPFTETSGSFINTEGRLQSFNAVAKPLGQTRPAWKVLRVLGNMFGFEGFAFDSSAEVCEDAMKSAKAFDNTTASFIPSASGAQSGLQRISDVPIYFSDALVRRASSLQKTRDARAPVAGLCEADIARFGVKAGELVTLTSSSGAIRIKCVADNSVPENCVRVAAGHADTAKLGGMFASLNVEPI